MTAEAKVIEHEFCLILLVWLSKNVLLSEVALGIQCCRQDGDCAQTGSQGREDCVPTTTTMQGESASALVRPHGKTRTQLCRSKVPWCEFKKGERERVMDQIHPRSRAALEHISHGSCKMFFRYVVTLRSLVSVPVSQLSELHVTQVGTFPHLIGASPPMSNAIETTTEQKPRVTHKSRHRIPTNIRVRMWRVLKKN